MRTCHGACRLILAVLCLLAIAGGGWGQAPEGGTDKPLALLAAIEGPIGPGSVRHVEKAVAAAAERDADVLVLRLDTPGGLATSMREIIADILGSSVPVIGYVAPGGAHAASAGTYILYATHVAAMAPGTNLGAATPVQIGGGFPGTPPQEDDKPQEQGEPPKEGEAPQGDEEGGDAPRSAPDDAMTAKMVNDAVAFIRSLAEMHGRNAEWAEKAVREGASLPAHEAVAMHVADLMADDVEDLLDKADGRQVIAGSAQRTLRTADATVETLEPGFLTRLLSLLSNPNVAFILLMVGMYGLIFEFANPGSIGPGVAGAICLVLGLFALNQLPIDYAGLALVMLGVAFMVAEAITPTFGVLGVGGLVAFVIGATMLIDTDQPAYQISWWVIGGMAAASGAVLVLLLGYVWRVYRRPGQRRREGLPEEEARVLDWSGDTGHVWAHGERWAARGTAGLSAGETVRVLGVDGLTLIVGAKESGELPGSGTPQAEGG